MVLHPLQQCQKSQAVFLASCPAQERRFHELMFSYGNAAYIYHQQARELNPTETDYQEWVEGLQENMRKDKQQKGFEQCKTVLSFTRYVMEKNDIGMEAFIIELMGMEDYSELKNLEKNKE